MKITIEAEKGEEFKKLEWEHVSQFALTGNFLRLGQFPARIYRTHINEDPNVLWGQLETLKGMVQDQKPEWFKGQKEFEKKLKVKQAKK